MYTCEYVCKTILHGCTYPTYLFIIYSRAIVLLGNIIWEHYMGNPIIIPKLRDTFIRDKSVFIILYLLLYK